MSGSTTHRPRKAIRLCRSRVRNSQSASSTRRSAPCSAPGPLISCLYRRVAVLSVVTFWAVIWLLVGAPRP